MHTKLKSQIRLIRWMIRRVRLLLQSPQNAKRTNFMPQVGDNAILCSTHVYSLPNGEKTTKVKMA